MALTLDVLPPGFDHRRVLRFGPDFGGGAALWAFGGLVSPGDVGLSPGLCQRVLGWADVFEENTGYDGRRLHQDFDDDAFERDGDQLASLVALEVGAGFAVQRTTGAALPTFRSDRPATRPQAAAVLEQGIVKDDLERPLVRGYFVAANIPPSERCASRLKPDQPADPSAEV